MRAIETTGNIDSSGILKLNNPVNLKNSKNVRVIILINEENEIEEKLWNKAISNNPAFEFLKAKEEDIYSFKDGKPYNE
ncbi:MAG: hypothetical protein FVQ77_00765 [Cytophagales bacterium]|nr:hypothetical protein [Cytophagales bacterium]